MLRNPFVVGTSRGHQQRSGDAGRRDARCEPDQGRAKGARHESQAGSLIPILFNMKLKKIFLSNIFGVAPGIFISVSLVSGISSKIEEGHPFNLDLLSDPKISIPLTALGIMVLIVNFVKQKFFKSKI